MTQLIRFDRILHVFYPAVVFLAFALSWNAASQAGNKIDFQFPNLDEPSGRAPASSAQGCSADTRADLSSESSCRIDSDERSTTRQPSATGTQVN
jgi:hypothetical protein